MTAVDNQLSLTVDPGRQCRTRLSYGAGDKGHWGI